MSYIGYPEKKVLTSQEHLLFPTQVARDVGHQDYSLSSSSSFTRSPVPSTKSLGLSWISLDLSSLASGASSILVSFASTFRLEKGRNETNYIYFLKYYGNYDDNDDNDDNGYDDEEYDDDDEDDRDDYFKSSYDDIA